jgi:hypothetical protein
MATLFGKSWTRQELLKHVGDIGQIAGIRLAEISDGPGRGVRIAEFRTGSGLSFTVLVDRGLDIHDATFKGIPVAFQTAAGVRHPAYYEPAGTGWLRNFHGGWLTTCGLTNVGPPGSDEFGEYEFHGRASNLPATLSGYGGRWMENEYELWLEGSIRETALFGFDLQLTRRLTARLGESQIEIVDRIENLGERQAPFMLLYHCNFGFPLVAKGSRLVLNQKSVQPRDRAAKAGLENHLIMDSPQSGYAEQVFFHELNSDADGYVTVAIVNEELGIAAYVSYRQHELPYFVEWKQMGSGEYVLGLEPANCLVFGRASERKHGRLQMLSPGECREMILRLGVVEGNEDIGRLCESVHNLKTLS